MGEELFYLGSNPAAPSGGKVTHGGCGCVAGLFSKDMSFPSTVGNASCLLESLSRELPLTNTFKTSQHKIQYDATCPNHMVKLAALDKFVEATKTSIKAVLWKIPGANARGSKFPH